MSVIFSNYVQNVQLRFFAMSQLVTELFSSFLLNEFNQFANETRQFL
jgi:hypothetical protein